jgi:amino acid adenylation domain-containing protein
LVATELNDTRHDFPRESCLPDLLWEHALEHPNSIAVVHENDRLTYRELARRSWDLASYLRYLDVAPDDCVGIFVEPSIELMVGVWGTLLSDAAYLPLSPEYPEERLRYMIEDARATVIFSEEALKARLAELAPEGTRIVTLGDAAEFAGSRAAADERERDGGPRPSNLAYVIYTSGSTGKPKGVMIEHRSIVNQLHWLRNVYGLDREKVVLQKTPMSFDAAQWEILAPGCGSKVVMGSAGVYRDPEGLIDTITAHGVTTLQCVPTLLQALVDTERLHRCTSLRQIFSGGEVLSRRLALRCIEALPWCELVNLYGPTECTINSSAFTVDRDSLHDGPQAVSIGAPVHNTRYYILDDSRKPVAVGEVGQLYIGGIQVARGYLHRPELTAERFVDDPCGDGARHGRLFKSGDLAYWNADGTVQFVGRADNQVKLRGFRVELDEVRLAIETHDWVRRAAVIVKDDPRTGFQNLIACVELSPKEAALMDQGNHGSHHQSKQSKLQVRAQLSNPGLRDAGELAGRAVVALPGKEPTPRQRREVFARKTYRFFEGGEVTKADLLRLLGRQVTGTGSRGLDSLDLAELGEILRYFGQYHSGERLLPKYGYASPGSLYATQMYLEITAMDGLRPGYYYYHPMHHELVLISEKAGGAARRTKVHLIGKKRAIEPVYKNNIQEVLEIETGHMVGLFEEVLPRYGLDIRDLEYAPAAKAALDCADEDYYLGTFEIVPWTGPQSGRSVDIYVQAHPGKVVDLPAGQYRYQDGGLKKVSDELILKKHVVAINQQVYERASVGITAVSRNRDAWLRYVDLGRTLQHLSMNEVGLGFMSSGYSSKTGNDLPSAERIDRILTARGMRTGPSYFFVGGRVSDEQRRSEGMKEDLVHMKGPAEMIRDDLVKVLPHYMIPNKVVVLDALPVTANGKVDVKALAASDKTNVDLAERPFVAPRTSTERRISDIWKQAMKRDAVSVCDDFFESGGNSLIAVALINKLNREFQSSLPLQVLFESPTIEKLVRRLGGADAEPSSRVVRLWGEGAKEPVFCWPGLGGYTMNLRLLASTVDIDRSLYGIQAYGINQDETPCATIRQMAAEDLEEIQRQQPVGPYTLWGYSFGARVAFEAAYQLEQSGELVENLFLIAPGTPKVAVDDERARSDAASFGNKAYVTILFSVFAAGINDPALEECLRVARDDESFASFISERFNLDPDLVRRVAAVVHRTFELRNDACELAGRQISAPVTIFKARGDDRSFIENGNRYSSTAPTVIDLEADHYSMLKEPAIGELVSRIRHRLRVETQEDVVPHVNIKHFPVALTEEQQAELVARVTEAVKSAFSCDEGVISIALEPVEKEVWNDRVYIPEIVSRKDLLCKSPSY